MRRKSLILSSFLSIIAVLSLVGCGSSTPKGSDEEVKKLVLDIGRQETRRQVTPLLYQKVSGIPVAMLGMEVSYEKLVKSAGDDANAKKAVEEIDEAMSHLKLSLEKIRTQEIDDKLKKSTSAADLRSGDETTPIAYTAQLNDQGRLYVEVFGL